MNEKAERKDRIDGLVTELNQMEETHPGVVQLWRYKVVRLSHGKMSAICSCLFIIFAVFFTISFCFDKNALLEFGIPQALICGRATAAYSIGGIVSAIGIFVVIGHDDACTIEVGYRYKDIKLLEQARIEAEEAIQKYETRRAELQKQREKFEQLKPIVTNELYGKFIIKPKKGKHGKAKVSILGVTDHYDLDENGYIRLLRDVMAARESDECKRIHEFETSLSEVGKG